MIQNVHITAILKLSIEERINAMEEILHSIEQDKSDNISPEQLILLERRLEEYHTNPSIALSWDEAKSRISSSRAR